VAGLEAAASRALCRNAELIVMDEPTAALSRPDVDALHGVIRQLAANGTTVVLVSHFLGEVLELADEVTILRDGRLVQTVSAAGQTEESLMAAMLGRSLDATFPAKRPAAADARTVLSVRDLVAPGVNGVSFDLRAGEILGLAGLVGAARTEVARAIYRANRVQSGSVTVAAGGRTDPHQVNVTGTPRAAMRAGVQMIPESRKDQGLLLGRPVRENVSLSTLAQVSRFGMVQRGPERPCGTCSAGWTPEAAARRSRRRRCRAATSRSCCSPGRAHPGVDVGAKRAIYELLTTLTADGLGILLISSDVEEILGLAHRVLVMRGGRVVTELTGENATEAAILGAAFGAFDSERGA
jgi:ABC-type sugar transport system ATPase subunit